MFHSVILQDMDFRMMPNKAWFTPHIVAKWELESNALFHRGQSRQAVESYHVALQPD